MKSLRKIFPKSKVLITGASGFLGKNLVEQLGGKYNLLTPSHKELDLLDEKAGESYLRKHKVLAVVHCAAVGISRKNNTSKAFFLNLRMFENLARCHRLYGKMIFIGSGAEYDKRNNLSKVGESAFGEKVPVDPYGFYKYLCSKRIEGIPNIINLRSFAVFGKYEDYETRFISNAICRSLFDLPITIVQNVYFDYYSVNDLVKAVDYFITHKSKYQFYNVGSGKKISLTQIVAKINKLAGKKLQVSIKKPGLNKEYTCNNKRLMAEIPKLKFTSFDQSLSELYEWYKQRKGSIKREKLLFDK